MLWEGTKGPSRFFVFFFVGRVRFSEDMWARRRGDTDWNGYGRIDQTTRDRVVNVNFDFDLS